LNADKGKLTSELNDRLDDLFSETDEGQAKAPVTPPAVPADTGGKSAAPSDESPPAPQKASPLMELDAIVLSLDWEITDENLEKLLNEIERLKTLYKDARLPYMFLQLHGSVGKYIASKKVAAHPDSIKLLHSVHAGLEKVLLNPDMDETEKKKILSEEVKKFKDLKHQIMLTKSTAPEEAEGVTAKKTLAPATPSPAAPAVPASAGDFNYQTFIDEIRKIIQAEFKELKREIMSWKEGQ